jgi:hypothetical protein
MMVGGWPVYLTLCFSVLAFPLAIVALAIGVRGRSRGAAFGLGGSAIVLGLVIMGLGVFGYFHGMALVDDALANASVASREALRARGQEESLQSVWIAIGGAIFPILCGAVAIVRGLSAKPDERPS